MLIVGSGIARLGSEEASLISETSIIRDQHTAPASRDDFITIERVDAEKAERPRRCFAISRAEGFGRVLDQFDSVLIAARFDRGDVCRLTIKVHEDKRRGRLTRLGFLFDDGAGQRGVHIPTAFFGIDEDGLGAEISDRRSGGDEGQRRAEDFVARSDAREAERKMQGSGSG